MIIIIAALTKNRVIGKGGKIPWDIPEELELFREFTKDSTVIMGRKTFESIGHPLPNRNNIIVSTTMENALEYDVVSDMKHAVLLAKTYGKTIFIIGGHQVYKEGLAVADKMYLSWIKEEYEGDTTFPEFGDEWEIERREDREKFELVIYERRDT